MPLSSEKATGEKNKTPAAFSVWCMRKFWGNKNFLCRLCGIDRGNPACSFSFFAAFICFDGSCAVYCAPDSEGSHKEGDSAIDENFRVAEGAEVACAGNSENSDDSRCCHNFEDEV